LLSPGTVSGVSPSSTTDLWHAFSRLTCFDMSSCLKIFWDRLPFVVSLRKIYLCY
jgi:hypothetical protein